MENLTSLSSLVKSAIRNKSKITQSLSTVLTSTVSKIGQIKTNVIYTIIHSDLTPLSRKQVEINSGEVAHLLGRTYNSEQYYKFLFVFRNTFWFTYREGIPDIESDNGWGCMIRAVQMVFAEVLKRHFKFKDEEKDRCQVIGYFSEQREGALSLQQICNEGNINKRWTSALQILSIAKKIMTKYPEHFGFQFQIYSSGILFKKPENILLSKYPAFIVLTTRVSLDVIPQQIWGHFFALMRFPSWVGSIGGVRGQALYIVGSINTKVIFLDPHYVHSNQQNSQTDTYCCKTPRTIDISQLNPSISYCYYFQNQKQHYDWINWISQTCQKYYPSLVFEFMSQSSKTKAESYQTNIYETSIIKKSESTEMLQKENKNTFTIEIVSDGHSDSGQFQILQ